MKTFVIQEKFTGYADITIEAETEDEAIALYNRGYYKDSNYDVDDMTYDHEFSDIREETDETVLREEEKLYLPTIREFYPHLDGMLTERIAKYCAIYSKGTDKASIRQAINDFEEVFDQELTQ